MRVLANRKSRSPPGARTRKQRSAGRRLVFVAIAVNGYVLQSWMCDCRYQNKDFDYTPPGLVADLRRARQKPDGSVVIDAAALQGVRHGQDN